MLGKIWRISIIQIPNCLKINSNIFLEIRLFSTQIYLKFLLYLIPIDSHSRHSWKMSINIHKSKICRRSKCFTKAIFYITLQRFNFFNILHQIYKFLCIIFLSCIWLFHKEINQHKLALLSSPLCSLFIGLHLLDQNKKNK